MVKKSPEEIYDSFNTHGCVKFETIDNKLIGVMGIYKYKLLYEAGSLCVIDEFKGKGFSYHIQKILMDKISEKNGFVVTSVPTVQYNSEKMGLIEIKVDDINPEHLKLIEDGDELSLSDKVYFNKKLYVNNKFYSLTEDENENN